MAELASIIFETDATAHDAYRRAVRSWKRAEPGLYGVALVAIDDHGTATVQTPETANAPTQSMIGTVLVGAVLGAIFLVPVLGIAVGSAAAALFASADHPGVRTEIGDRVRESIRPGHTGVVLYCTTDTADTLCPQLAGDDGRIERTTLSEADQAALVNLIEDAGA